MAQLENFRGPFLGCAGGESREEKEYLAQHPQPSNEQPRAPETESPDQEAPSTASNASYAIPPTTDSGNFAVDVGSFGSAEMADQMIERLANVNLPAYLEPTKLNGGDVSRVLIGRFEDRFIAESARQHAKEAVGIDAEVIDLRVE